MANCTSRTTEPPTTLSILILHAADARSTTWHSCRNFCEHAGGSERVRQREKEETSSTNYPTPVLELECFS